MDEKKGWNYFIEYWIKLVSSKVRILCLVLFIFLLFYDTMQKNQGGYKC